LEAVSTLFSGPVIRDIHPEDAMYATPLLRSVYFEAGTSAVENITAAMDAANLGPPRQILDFACGHGRVLRALKAAFPEAQLTAADVNPSGVEFCAQTFGARPIESQYRVELVDLGGPFDLIWVGSLFTHVDAGMFGRLLGHLSSALDRRGLLVFTTLGHWAVGGLRARTNLASFRPEQVEGVLRDYDRTGFGFDVTYDPRVRAGDCIVTPAWVRHQLDEHALSPVLYVEGSDERGWTGQDVFGCVRADLAG
jgi:SAM-dependent methyltransferase